MAAAGRDGTAPVVACDRAARTYDTGRRAVVAVHGATCAVVAGQVVAVTGASGSGKTTLLHLLAGIERPDAGSVTWPALGFAAPPLGPARVGVVFQGARLLPSLTVAENVRLPLQLAGVAAASAAARAPAALDRLHLLDLADRLPPELSGGQAQRVAVARAMVSAPRLLLADEPTGQLDRATAREVVATLRAAADETGAALVVTTHDEDVAALLPERWAMRDGRLSC
jgi:putative ABC transport system ATP-binding protein